MVNRLYLILQQISLLMLVLMEESKLTVLQRKTIQQAVDKGESLPASIDPPLKKNKVQDNQVNILVQKYPKRFVFL